MIKGALFTLGILCVLGGFGFAALSVFAAGMSDVPGAPSGAGIPAAIGVVGIVLIIAAINIPK